MALDQETGGIALHLQAQGAASVVLVDELALVREGVAEVIEATGRYRVVAQCGDGLTALEQVALRRPEIVVVDYSIPRLFSLELVRKLHSEGLASLIVMLSARGDRKLVLECLRAGVNGFVLKTGPCRNLLHALDQISTGGVYVSPEVQLDKLFCGRRDAPEDPIDTLSSREYQVFSLLIEGIRAKEIAARLDLSPKTVDTYRASLMRKLDIHDVAGLVKFAIQKEITTAA